MMKWQSRPIGDFLSESKVISTNPSVEHRIRVRLNVEGVEKRPIVAERKGVTRYFIRSSGQFIYGKQNLHKGAFGVIPDELDGFESSSDLPAFDISEDIRPKWIEYFFKQGDYYKTLVSLAKGAATKRIQPTTLFGIRIPYPPLHIQDKLIFQMDTCCSEQSKILREISHEETLLAKLKQAILQEAIQGKLTADWRKENSDVEPASQLLERIQQEKQRLIIEKKIRKEKPQPPITPKEIPFEIPDSWEWCRLGTLIEKKPRNGISLKPVEYKTDAKTLKLSATSSGTFDGSQCKYLNLKVDPDSYLWLRDGDILIQRANSLELVGTTAVYRGRDFEFIYPDLMMKCRTVFLESTDYLHHVLSSQTNKNYFQSKASGSAGNMPKVSQTTVIATLIPLPPLGEQIAITKRVKALLDLCRQLETEIKHSRTNAENLLQAVLKEAFTSKTI